MATFCYDQPKLHHTMTDSQEKSTLQLAALLRNCSVHNTKYTLPRRKNVLSVIVKELKLSSTTKQN